MVYTLKCKILEGLQYNIFLLRDVHIRIEDNRTNKGYPFGAGVTLDKLDISTNKQDRVSKVSRKLGGIFVYYFSTKCANEEEY